MKLTVMEELWFGDFPDENAEKKAADSFVAKMSKIHGVKPFPIAAQNLITLTNNPDYKIDDLEQVIKSDPSLATKILQVVNSAAYALQVRCTSIAHAVRLLGSKTIRELATALSLHDFYGKDPRARTLRDHGAVVAALSRQLAMRTGHTSDDVYTCGLLHDLGKVIWLQISPKEYSPILNKTLKERDICHIEERERFGYDHAVLAAHLLSLWKIPEPVPQSVAWHHQPARAYKAGGKVAVIVSLIRFADRLSYEFEHLEKPDETVITQMCADESAIYLHISPNDLTEYWDNLNVVSQESRQI